MPRSRQRKKKQVIIQYIDVYKKRETKFGEVNEHVGVKAINKHYVASQIDQKKTELEKEAYKAWKAQRKVQKDAGLPAIDMNNFITEYIGWKGVQ